MLAPQSPTMSEDPKPGDSNSRLAVPIPIRKHNAAVTNSHNVRISSPLASTGFASFTPNTSMNIHQHRRPSYSSIETSRESHYNLDYPRDAAVLSRLQLDPKSRFYARDRPRTLDLPGLLPYETENPQDRAKFLSHIVAHLYIAVKSLDLQGSLSITAKDLASLKDVAGLSDIDLALETNLFEMNTAKETIDDDDQTDYFPHEDLDVEDDDEGDDEGDDDDDEQDDDSEGEEDGGYVQDDGHEDFESGESTVQHKKSPKSAAVVSVRIWTQELLVWLKMKYDMPLTLRMSLARVYFAICCCRGQQLNLRIYVKAFELLTKNVHLLTLNGFTLPWNPIYLELTCHFSSVDSTFEPVEKMDLNILLRLAERASNFFPAEGLPVIFRHLSSRFSIVNASLVLSSLSMLPLTFNADYGFGHSDDTLDVRHYIPSLFYMWNKLSRSAGIESHLTGHLGSISMMFLTYLSNNPLAKETFGKFGVFSEERFNYLINTLLNSLSINIEKFASMKTKFFHGFSSAIVFSINGNQSLLKDGILDHLDTILNAIKSYVHPSNSGEWSRPISKFVLSATYQFHKRYNMEREPTGVLHQLDEEHKISNEVRDRFVKSMLPVVRTGLQSKRSSAGEDYIASLGLLAYLNSDLTLGYILLDIYESLEGVISTHRVVTALRCIEELARYFASTPGFRVHLVRILTMALPGIDSNDLSKTMHTLNAFSAVANFVPIADLTNGELDAGLAMEFTNMQLEQLESQIFSGPSVSQSVWSIDQELEVRALKSSTSAFKLLMKSFAERIFTLLENIPDPSKSNGIEKDLCDVLPKFVYLIIEAMSDDIFKSFRDEVTNLILDHTIHAIADVIAEICGGLIRRDPPFFKRFGPLLIDRIKEDVLENGAGQARTGIDIVPRDQNMFWNLVILNECIGNAGSVIVDMGEELNDLSFFLMDNVKGPTVFASTYLLNQMLQGTTKIRLAETRLISPQFAEKHEVDEKCWGGFQFDEYRFSQENLTFQWFIPTDREIEFAVATFKHHTSKALSNILNVMKKISGSKDNISLELSDELRVNFLYLAYGMSGISYLFDPSFDEDIPKLSDHKFESIQHRLLLLAQIRDMKSSKFADKDYGETDNIYENLQQIADNIESNDAIDFNVDSEKIDREEGFEYLSKKNESMESLDDSDGSKYKRTEMNSLSKSESPTMDESDRATPCLAGVEMSTMNPAITFRERKLYTSRYFFGDDIEGRRSNELYLQIHRTRHLIGKSLHIISKFMMVHLSDNTKLFKHLLYILNIWFADVGRERILDQTHAKISSSYVNEIQQINRVRKPFTRVLLGCRIESYHLLRVALHATSRNMTDLDKFLIEDLVKLSCSNYTAIADPAQSTLIDAMKRVNGSYYVIVRTAFRLISKAIQENNHKNIESGLSIFDLKKVKVKMQNDYLNIQKFVEILHKCLNVDNKDVNELAQDLFKNLIGTISAPSKYCLIDHALVDSIRPPDEFIDLEIKAVSLAKEKKRKIYLDKLDKLEDSVVVIEKHNTHWKTTTLNIKFLVDLQTDYNRPCSNDVFQLLTKSASFDHPLVSRLAIKGITKILKKFYVLSAYEYDLSKILDLEYVVKDLKVIDTEPHGGESYYHTWRKELKNVDHPNYFIDHRVESGWLFWDKTMRAVTSEPCFKLTLNERDESIVRGFSKCVNKEWLKNIVNLWIADNEANSAFQGTDVYMIESLVLLLSNGWIENMLFQDLLDIIGDVYERTEKSTHIVSCEMIAGILMGAKVFNTEMVDTRDEFLCKFLKNLLENDLTPETKNVWTIFSWWIPSDVDIRRFPKVTDVLLNVTINEDSDSALNGATRISYIRSLVAAIPWSFPDPESVLDLCFSNIANRYQAIREQIGALLAITTFSFYGDSFATCDEFVHASHDEGFQLYKRSMHALLFGRLTDLFETVEQSRKEIEHLSAQEILKSRYIYAATTTLCWLKQALNTSISIQFQGLVVPHIVPYLLNLVAMKDVCQLGGIDPLKAFKKVSQMPYDAENLENVVAMLEKYSKSSLNVVQSFILGEFTETIYFKNLFALTTDQKLRILNLTSSALYQKNLEFREASATTFSGLIHTSPPADVERIVNEYKSKFSRELDQIRKKYRKVGFKNMAQEDIIILHGATLGLGALVHAFSFLSPPPKWIPEILTILSNKASGIPGIVGRSAKETLGKFKKTRQDTWHIDSKVFNESQAHDLEGVLWKSYFI